MSVLYLREQNAKISKQGNRIVVVQDNKNILDIPVRKVDRILIFGNIQITTQAMTVLLDEQVDVAFFSQRGRLKGTLNGMMSKNIHLRLAQYECWHDESTRIQMGQQFIRSKLDNMVQILLRYNYNHTEADFGSSIDIIKQKAKTLSTMNNAESIMGVEGYSSRIYFECFARMCRREMQFPGRHKHPSTDPVNALLSLGYTLVGSEITAVLEGMSFDPYLGFLHGIKYGRQSLALDMLEEFRQAIIDPFTLKLINNRMFTEGDFVTSDDGGMLLNDEAFKRYIAYYEERMTRSTAKSSDGKNSWRDMIYVQARELEHAIMEKRPYRAHNFA